MKKILSLLISGFILFSSGISLAYPDTSGHWSEDYINMISKYGVMRGYLDGSFKPNDYVTRAEVAKVLSTHKFGKELDTYEFTGSFWDVAFYRDHWASNEISYIHKLGYMQGYPDQYFRPDNPITRAELAETLNKHTSETSIDFSPSYPDVSPADWFYKSVLKSSVNRTMQGYPDGTFKPNNYITRAELAKVMSIYYYDYYIPSPEEAADPYEWNPGVKEMFEQSMVSMGYVNSPSELTYEKFDVYNGCGHYVVRRVGESQQLVGVNCKTGWFHG